MDNLSLDEKHPLHNYRLLLVAFRFITTVAGSLLIFFPLRAYNRIPGAAAGDQDVPLMVIAEHQIIYYWALTVAAGIVTNLHNLACYLAYFFDSANAQFLIYSFTFDVLLGVGYLMLATTDIVRGGLGLGLNYICLCLAASLGFFACSYLDISAMVIFKYTPPTDLGGFHSIFFPKAANTREKNIATQTNQPDPPEAPVTGNATTGGMRENISDQAIALPARPERAQRSAITVADVLTDSDGL